ncbi:hypothetical protein RRG08_066722 [Elysia crispata]|uniref:Uncharacterized protein n=1 Tax=Elysia crispata TaxID=231223 RepID=A0AAE1B8I3_9GAST|nr:hypothetical protein RRG08_066722 [Elysia crispata]
MQCLALTLVTSPAKVFSRLFHDQPSRLDQNTPSGRCPKRFSVKVIGEILVDVRLVRHFHTWRVPAGVPLHVGCCYCQVKSVIQELQAQRESPLPSLAGLRQKDGQSVKTLPGRPGDQQ